MSNNEDPNTAPPEVPSSSLTILVADDHWVSRTGMRHLLRGLDVDVTMLEASSFGDALARLAENPDLDLMVLDLLMPDRDAFDGLAALIQAAGATPVVVLSMVDDRRSATRAIELGAVGYIAKTGDADETLGAIQTVLSGDIYLPADLTGDVDETGGTESTDEADDVRRHLDRLTRRQRDVFMRLGSGRTTNEIAGDLDITEYTVRGHIAAVMCKLGLKNRTQAALLASRIMPE